MASAKFEADAVTDGERAARITVELTRKRDYRRPYNFRSCVRALSLLRFAGKACKGTMAHSTPLGSDSPMPGSHAISTSVQPFEQLVCTRWLCVLVMGSIGHTRVPHRRVATPAVAGAHPGITEQLMRDDTIIERGNQEVAFSFS